MNFRQAPLAMLTVAILAGCAKQSTDTAATAKSGAPPTKAESGAATGTIEVASQAAKDVSVRAFRAHVAEEDLRRLKRRIAETRWPNKETVADQSQGIQLAKLRPLVEYWGGPYDWRKPKRGSTLTRNSLPGSMESTFTSSM